MLSTLLLIAEDPPAPQQQQPWWGMLVWMAPVVVLFYFLMIRPMRRQEQQRQQLASHLKKNDKVITHAGIIGTVVSVSEKEDEVTIKVDDNVRLKFLKSAIARNVTQEEALKEAKGSGSTTDGSKT